MQDSTAGSLLIDLNHILLFLALASPIVLLARVARQSPRPVGWTTAALLVLGGTGLSWLLIPGRAGFAGGALWGALLFLPSLAEKKIRLLVLEKRYGRARQLALVRRFLHPWDDSPYRSALLRSLEDAGAGRWSAALDRLARERSERTPAGRCAIAFTHALTGNWPGLVEWCRRDLRVAHDPAITRLYLRALGETGALDDLAWAVAARRQTSEPAPTISPARAEEFLYLFAFTGRVEAVVRLGQGPLRRWPEAEREFWIATAELAAGQNDAATTRLTRLQGAPGDALLARAIERRQFQARAPQPLRFSAASEKLIDRLRAETPGLQAETRSRKRSQRGTPAVWALILLNVAMFALEMLLGGATNGDTLHLLGALEPDAVLVRHEYWRLLTALFLHYGFLHILFNMYALYLLGPAVERTIGSGKFLWGYLLSGLGSGAAVVCLRVFSLTKADQLVGASGCVMGVIGISAGLLLHQRTSAWAGRRLRYIVAIVAFQTVFDLFTPQVSLAAHLSGFVTGLVVGAILAARRAPVPR